jgi:hypothetical protein
VISTPAAAWPIIEGDASAGHRKPSAIPGTRREPNRPQDSSSKHCRFDSRPSNERLSVAPYIRTILSGWAYGAIYRESSERTAALDE